jgi:hypothetical protein
VYLSPPLAVWTCRVYPFPPAPAVQNGLRDFIPLHRRAIARTSADRIKGPSFGTGMSKYQNEMPDIGMPMPPTSVLMPMPATSASMPMPSYGLNIIQRDYLKMTDKIITPVFYSYGFSTQK